MKFVGKSLALSPAGLADVAGDLKVTVAEISAVISVETSGAGFLTDRRPKILFERHYFSKLTKRKYDKSNPDISAPTAGGYGPSGAPQYKRLEQAIKLNANAALQSASWGIGQVMGANYKLAGFDDVESMVAAMTESEDAQLQAMCSFVHQSGLSKSLAVHDWASFAAGYNGPSYKENRYDVLLNAYYQQYLAGATTDLRARAAQLYLSFRGFDPHGIDGVMGRMSVSALKMFQESVKLPAKGVLDDATMQALIPA